MFLPDINFWIALSFVTHQFHRPAKVWFDGLNAQTCYFCRHTQHGFLRLANNRSVMLAQAVPMAEAWRLYDVALSDVRIEFAEEPPGIEVAWRGYAVDQAFSPKRWADGYLAAFAVAGGYEVVTFDRGFTQYANLKVTILT